jgi:hypothetical protein
MEGEQDNLQHTEPSADERLALERFEATTRAGTVHSTSSFSVFYSSVLPAINEAKFLGLFLIGNCLESHTVTMQLLSEKIINLLRYLAGVCWGFQANFIIIISLMSPLPRRRPSLWITHKVNL